MFYFNFDIDSTERYDIIKFMPYTEGMYDILNSYFLIALCNLPTVGSYRVTSEYFRPDLVSYNIYNDVQYWWILMLYNNLFHYKELEVGIDIKYPSIGSIENLYFSLKSKEIKEL